MRGLPKSLIVGLFLTALCTAPILPATAQPGKEVSRVTKISEGGRLDFSRKEGSWYQGYVEMKDYVGDSLRTNADTFGSIEFYTGGQIGINKGTTISIASENTANVINLKSGGLWGKLAKQKEKPVEVRTSSGVMGIKGTEFVITEKDGGTEVAVLEGQVLATPADGGTPIEVNPGMTVLLKLKAVPVVTQGKPEDLRKSLLSSSEWNDFNKVLGWASYIGGYGPVSGVYQAQYYGTMAMDVVDDPQKAAANFAADQVGGPVGGALRQLGNKKKKPDFPTNLAPDYEASPSGAVPSSQLSFQWEKLDKAQKYAILLGRDSEMNDLAWMGETGSTAINYPADAAPLTAGKYFWRVIGLDKDGEPVGRAAQTWVEIAAP